MTSNYVRKIDAEETTWRKSSYSGDQGDCVEVAVVAHGTAARDSKAADGPVLDFSASAWQDFIKRLW